MGSIAKFHSRQTLSPTAALKLQVRDDYLEESIRAELRAKSYADAMEKGPTIHVGTASDVATAGTTSNEGNADTGREKLRSSKRTIKDPSLLAKKRAKAYARKKREEEQRQLQEHGKKWYHSGNRPLPTVGDINNVKKRAKLAMVRIKMERERKEKMDKIKHKELAFKKKLLYSEAQRIISENVGKFEKGSYIIRTEDRRKSDTAFDGCSAPSWQPTGYYNEIEYTRNTKKMADSFENKKGIFRLFSYP